MTLGTPIDLTQPLRLHRSISLVQVHHTAGPELDTPSQVEAHALARGVGFTCDPYQIHIWRGPDQGLGNNSWVVSWGRSMEAIPAGVKGDNQGAIAVVVHGDYSRGPLPIWARDKLVAVLRWLMSSLVLSLDAIQGHCELPGAATLCPGFDMTAIREVIRG